MYNEWDWSVILKEDDSNAFGHCSSLVSVVVIKHWPKVTWGTNSLFGLHSTVYYHGFTGWHLVTVLTSKVGAQARNLLACFPRFLSLHTTLDHMPKGDTTHSILVIYSVSITNQENAYSPSTARCYGGIFSTELPSFQGLGFHVKLTKTDQQSHPVWARELSTSSQNEPPSLTWEGVRSAFSQKEAVTLTEHFRWLKAIGPRSVSQFCLNNGLATRWQYNKHHIWTSILHIIQRRITQNKIADGKWHQQVRLDVTEAVSPRRHRVGKEHRS